MKYSCPAILNNYRTILFDKPIRGLRNLIAGSDNTGNILFLETIGSQIQACSPVNMWTDILNDPKHFEATYDALVLPLANMVSSSWSSPLPAALEKIRTPVILVSVGVQANSIEEVNSIEISKDARHILDIAAERSRSIGVRGAITAQFLRRHGYPCTIIGCPSLLGPAEDNRPIEQTDRIAIHNTLNGAWRDGVRNLFSFGFKYAQGYVAQSELYLLMSRYGVTDTQVEEWVKDPARLTTVKKRLNDCAYFATKDPTPIELHEWLQKNLTFFVDLASWKSYLSQFDFVIGTRFHGSAVATLAGTPSLLLTTDARVTELAEYHQVPRMPLTEFTKDMRPEDVAARIDYTVYRQVLPTAKQRYNEFLIENGLTPVGVID